MSTILTFFGTLSVGVVVWAFRLESRVNVLDQKHIDLRELINTRFDNSDKRLERIEKALNGAIDGKG